MAPNGEFVMAIRHQVQNLQRRGNIFYWRARLPTHLGRNIGSRHLAFSLKQSDHRQAGYMARKLNLMLYEIAENPRSVLMSKEALEGLFQSEIARMNDHMDNLQAASRSTTVGFHHIDNIRSDLEAGWAYRLLENLVPVGSCLKIHPVWAGVFSKGQTSCRACIKASLQHIVESENTQNHHASLVN